LLYIPLTTALFTGETSKKGDETSRTKELHSYADAATDAFLRAYGCHDLAGRHASR
jgi:hypothetical protein